MKNRRNRLLSNGLFYIIVFVILLAGINWAVGGSGSNGSTENIRYSQLVKDLKAGKVKSINVQPSNGVYTVTGSYKKAQKSNNQNNNGFGLIPSSQSSNEVTRFSTTMLQNDSMVKTISDLAQKSGASISGQGESQSGTWISTIVMLVPTLIFIVMLWMMMNQGGQGRGGGMMNFGKSHVKPQDPSKNKVRFSDVAGEEEEKQELVEIVEFLKNPAKYTKLGARIPAGVLLEGPPGTGKTLLARAVAGEAGVPFYSISGSDFVEMFVGVGASRVRDLFDQAKKNSPCIVFIDEIDAVGRRRGAGLGGGHDEREQTLNQLLVEMDGFGVNEGVIVVAATNRADILDPAILRPGRFDRQVYVGRPDVKGREAILRVHAKGKPLSSEVDLKVVAQTTSGFTGADLANLLNEAALLTARANKKAIDMEEIQKAFVKVGIGTEKKSRVISDKEKFITAYHESGHAILFELLSELDPVHSISIIPTGMAGGYTMPLPGEDRMYMTKLHMEQEIISFLGGRAAEYIVLKDVTTGASNDIQRATAMARSMVTQYGMSDILGPIQFGDDSNEVFIGRDWGHARNYSEDIATTIDKEVRRIVDTAYSEAIRMLKENMEILHASAKLLVEKEKITGEEFRELFDEEKRSKVLGVTTISENNEESKEENEKGVSLEKEQQKEVDLEKKEE